MSNRGKELAKNTAIVGAGKLCTQFVSFLLLPLYTSALSTAEYGTVDIINTYVLLLMPFFTLQLEQGLFRFLIDARKDREKIREIISTVLIFMFVIGAAYCGIIAAVGYLFHIPYSGYLLLNLVAIAFSNILLQTVRGLGNNLVYSVGSFLTALTTILLNIALVLMLGWGAEGMMLATALANFVCCGYLFLSQHLYRQFSLRIFRGQLLRELLRYSVPLIPNTISWWMVSASDRTIVTYVLGISYNGILSIAHKFSSIYNAIYEIFSLTWTESVVLYMDDKDGTEYINQSFNVVFNLFAAANVGIIACMPFLFPVLVDPAYYEAYYQIPILMAAALFNMIAGLLGAIYVNRKMTREIAISTLTAAGLNVLFHILLIRWIGLYAASVSSLLAYMVMALVRYRRVRQIIPLKLSAGSFLCTVIVAALTITCYYLQIFWLHILVLIVVILYAVLLNRSFLASALREAKNMLNARKNRQ